MRDVGNWPTLCFLALLLIFGAVLLAGDGQILAAIVVAGLGIMSFWHGRRYMLIECQYCRERINRRATACRSCGRMLSPH